MSRESRVQSSPGPIFFFVYFINKNKDSKDSQDRAISVFLSVVISTLPFLNHHDYSVQPPFA